MDNQDDDQTPEILKLVPRIVKFLQAAACGACLCGLIVSEAAGVFQIFALNAVLLGINLYGYWYRE